ncbi:uncharacterized protein [Typha latifolia]|uniref:uncharacterized protein n=1 Tax=Typha latifolia TaxID=4733 RepID=UPI003C30BD37
MEGKADGELSDIQGSQPMGQLFAKNPAPPPTEAADDSVPQCEQSGEAGDGEKAPASGNLETDADVGEEGVQMDGCSGAGAIAGCDGVEEEGFRVDECAGTSPAGGDDAAGEEAVQINEHPHPDTATHGDSDEVEEESLQIDEFSDRATAAGNDVVEEEEESVQIDEYPGTATVSGNGAVEEEGIRLDECPDTATCGDELEEEGAQVDGKRDKPDMTATAGEIAVNREDSQINECADMVATDGDHAVQEEGVQIDERPDTDMPVIAGDGSVEEEDLQIKEFPDTTATPGDDTVEEKSAKIGECPDTATGDGAAEEDCLENDEYPDAVSAAVSFMEEAVDQIDVYSDTMAGTGNNEVEEKGGQITEYPDATTTMGRNHTMEEKVVHIDGYPDAPTATHVVVLGEEDAKIDEYSDMVDTIGNDGAEEEDDRVDEHLDPVTVTVNDAREEEDVQIDGYPVTAADAGSSAVEEEGAQIDEYTTTTTDAVAEEDAQIDEYPGKSTAAGNDDVEEEDDQIDEYPDTSTAAGDDAVDEEDARVDEYPDTSIAPGNDALEEDAQFDEYPYTNTTAVDDVEEAEQMDEEAEEPPPISVRRGGGRRKRGRPPKQQAGRAPARRKDDEEVCFICFDGGELVVCDRRGCPKVYHPACVNRDEAFFRAKGRWNCGWHICSNCEKSARFMCYTCTHSLCNGCIKESEFVCVRGNKGFCQTCLSTVMLIEKNENGNETMDGVDFNDKNSWEYLFKDYWLDLKRKLSLTLEELSAAESQKKGSLVVAHGEESSGDARDGNGDQGASSDSSAGHHDETKSSRKRSRQRTKHTVREKEPRKEAVGRALSKRSLSSHRDGQSSSRKKMKKLLRDSASNEDLAKGENVGTSISEGVSWASKELLDFVAHMKDGDRSVLSQFDVQALLLEYIKRNNLRDPRRKSQIVCDPLLQNLFGKQRVGHFEMLKLLESHFLMNEASPVDTDDNQGGVVDPDPSQMDVEGNSEASFIMSSEKRRKSRKKIGERGPQTNLDDYAAIDVHNINLMYLRRNLMEDLIDNTDALSEKVVGSFVRIRISGTGQRQDIYRLVQVIGTGKAAEKYKTGKKMTDITLEILNLDKKEVITIDIISNQEFSEEECKRLRQSIKCGLIGRLTVGEVQEKARVLQAVRVNDWIESEKLRLGHLRDRASEKGHRKELRECVEKLQLLSTPEERIRRLNEVPEIHADPNMDPDYETSEEGEPEVGKKENYGRPRDSYLMKGKEVISPAKVSPVSSNNWSSARKILKVNWDPNRSTLAEGTSLESSTGLVEKANGYSWNKDKDAQQTSNLTTLKGGANATNIEVILNNNQHGQSPGLSSGTPSAAPASGVAATLNINESEKIWHYVDPSGKTQGPFSMTQLRKWNTTGYFPPNLRIWKSSEKQEDAISLSNALTGKFQNDLSELEVQHSSASLSNKIETRTNLEGGFGGNKSTFLAGSVTNYANVTASNMSRSHTSVNELVKADKFDAQASALSATKLGGGRLEISPGGWESSKDSNAWSRQSYGPNEPRPVASFAGTPYRSPSDQGRGSQSGTAGAWMGGEDHGSNHGPMGLHAGGPGYGKPISHSSSSSQQSSGGSWKGQPGYASSTQWGANPTDLPTPTPHPSTGDFTVVRDSLPKEPINVEDRNSGLAESVLPPRTANTTERISSPKLGNKVDGLGNFQAAYELPSKAASADVSKSIVVGSGESKVDSVVDVGLGNSAVPAFFSPQGETLKRSLSISAEGLVAQRTADPESNLVPEGAIPEASRSSVQHRTDSGFQQKPDDLTLSYLLAKHVSDQSIIQKSQASLSDPVPMSSCNFGAAQDTRNVQQPMMLQTVTNMPYSTLENNQEKSSVMSGGSNQMLSSQMRATTSMEHAHISNAEFDVGANSQNTGWVVAPAAQQNAKLIAGQAQGSGSMNMGTSAQGNVNMGWGMLPQVNMNMAWGTPAQGIANMGLGTTPQNLMMNQGWMAPNQGNTNANLVWATPGQGGTNPAAVWGAQFPGNTTGWVAPTQGNANTYPGWVAPTLANTSQNAGWGAPAQANMIANPGNGTGQGNLNMNWSSPNGNPGNWSNQQTETGGRHSAQGDNLQGSDSGHSSGRPLWNRMQSGGEGGSSRPPSGQKGVCRFHENGHCKKGASCNYFHS